MQQSLEQDLDIVSGRIAEIEKSLTIMHNNIMVLSEQLKDTQMFLVKLAKNQSEISKRVTKWPFIAVDMNQGDSTV